MDLDRANPIWHNLGMKKTGAPNKIRELREAAAWSQQQLADAVAPKTTQSQIDRLEKGDRKLTQDWMGKIAAALGVESKDLLPEVPKPIRESNSNRDAQRMVASPNLSTIAYQNGEKGLSSWNRDVPILGHAKAGIEGFFLDNGEVLGMAYRHPGQVGVKGAFAVYVRDESMIPAFKPGRVAWIHPSRPCVSGDDVLIELTDGQAFIKEYKRKTATHLICRQWNPDKEIKFDVNLVKHVYLVLGSYREE